MRRSSARLRTGDRLEDWQSEYERVKADRTMHIKLSETHGRIQRILGSKGASGSASLEILQDDAQIVSIICPLSKKQVETPARGLKCRHLQCFDLGAFLEDKGRDSENPVKWKCPLCIEILRVEDLRIDDYFMDIVKSAGATVREVEISADGSYRCLEPQESEAIEVHGVEADDAEDAEERDRAVVVPLSMLRDMHQMTQNILSAAAGGCADGDTLENMLGSLAELHIATKKCISESKPAADTQRAEQLDQKVQELEAKLKDAFDPFEVMKKMPAGFGIIGIPKKPPARNDSSDGGEQQETDGGHDDGAKQQEQQDDLSERLKKLEGHPVLMFFPPPTVAASDRRSEDAAESSPAASQPPVAVDAVDEREEGIVLRPGTFYVPLHSMDAAGNFEPLAMKHFGPKPSGLRLYPAIWASITADKVQLLVCPVDVGSIFGNGATDFAQILRLKCTVQYEITNTDRWTVDHMLGLSDILDEYCGLKPGIAVFGPQHVRYPRMIVNCPDDVYTKVMQSTDDSHENKLLKLLLQAGRQSTDQLNASS